MSSVPRQAHRLLCSCFCGFAGILRNDACQAWDNVGRQLTHRSRAERSVAYGSCREKELSARAALYGCRQRSWWELSASPGPCVGCRAGCEGMSGEADGVPIPACTPCVNSTDHGFWRAYLNRSEETSDS